MDMLRANRERPSVCAVQSATGLSKKALRNRIDRAADIGLLEVTSGVGAKPSSYRVLRDLDTPDESDNDAFAREERRDRYAALGRSDTASDTLDGLLA